jgi:hypothetical protein
VDGSLPVVLADEHGLWHASRWHWHATNAPGGIA